MSACVEKGMMVLPTLTTGVSAHADVQLVVRRQAVETEFGISGSCLLFLDWERFKHIIVSCRVMGQALDDWLTMTGLRLGLELAVGGEF